MSWWWSGMVGVAKKKMEMDMAAALAVAPVKYERTALVIGSSGLVGTSLLDILPLSDTPGGPWKVYAVSRHPLPSWSPPAVLDSPHVHHVQCDLSDPSAASAALSPLAPEITHIFYVAAENREYNASFLRNVLASTIPSAPSLTHICLETGRDHYIGATAGLIASPHEPPFHEGLPRLEANVFYYELEDILTEEVRKTEGKVSWSVHRPGVIFGFSPKSAMNLIGSLCVYAAICKKEGTKLRWPGSRVMWEAYNDASDADLVAEHQIWVAWDPDAKNEAFNCTDGDVFKWKQLWPILADAFEVEWVGYEGDDGTFKLEEEMAGKETVWETIVAENELIPTRLEEVGNWWFVDSVLHAESDYLLSMNKSKEYTFTGFRNTMTSFGTWIEKTKAYRIVP